MEKTRTLLVLSLICSLAMGGAIQAKVIYVNCSVGGGGLGDGTSWANAYVYLQDALEDAAAVSNDEICVAAGTYRPDLGDGYTEGDREASFILKNLVKIMGGYPPGGGSPAQRDPCAYPTILSGDLLQNDNPETAVEDLLTDPCRADNSYHVILGELCGSPTLLDGLIIADGQADGADTLGHGGGWYNIINSSPTLQNCVFTRNAASQRGGGWYNTGPNCRPLLTEVTFTVNYCADRGGGVAMLTTGSDAKLDHCQFIQNYAHNHGGGMYLDQSSPQVLDCEFSGDYASAGGALAGVATSEPVVTNSSFSGSTGTSGGAIYTSNCNMELNSCVFSTNTATYGGACYFVGGQGQLMDCEFTHNNSTVKGGAIYVYDDAAPQITQSVFYDNTAESQGGAIYNHDGHPNLKSCIFIGNYCADYGGAILNQVRSINYSNTHLTGYNCLFVGNYVTNSGSNGGAVASFDACGSGHCEYTYVTFINSTFYYNSAVNVGGGFYYNTSRSNTVTNCILYENTDTAGSNRGESAQIYGGANTVRYSCIQGLDTYAGNGNIDADPLFVDPLGPDYIGGTLDDNLRLSFGSPCIDAGDGTAVPADITTDLDGMPRFFDDPDIPDSGTGDPPIVDMGAYEHLNPSGPGSCGDYFHPYPEMDLNQDCAVNLIDLVMFGEHWLEHSMD